eukprot:scaffold78883_cov62-Phaeocystis_antarctica.AAC.3
MRSRDNPASNPGLLAREARCKNAQQNLSRTLLLHLLAMPAPRAPGVPSAGRQVPKVLWHRELARRAAKSHGRRQVYGFIDY